MKSIDEFATEYAQDKYLPVQTSQAVKAGANYVLGEIENLVKTTIGDGEDYHYNLYIGLVNLLEQLKK
jgi:hypothetical protein